MSDLKNPIATPWKIEAGGNQRTRQINAVNGGCDGHASVVYDAPSKSFAARVRYRDETLDAIEDFDNWAQARAWCDAELTRMGIELLNTAHPLQAETSSHKCKLCGVAAAPTTELQIRGDHLYCIDTEACATRTKNLGRKDDHQKPRHSLIPTGTIAEILQVLEFGAKKYGEANWSKVDNLKQRYYDAAHRHIEAWWKGEVADDETGASHLAHAMCCLLFLRGKELEISTPTAIVTFADLVTGRAKLITICGYRFKTGTLCGAVQGHLGTAAHNGTAADCAAAHGEPPPGMVWCKRCEEIHKALACGCPCQGNGACHSGCGCPCPNTCWCWKVEGHKERVNYKPPIVEVCTWCGTNLRVDTALCWDGRSMHTCF